MKNADDERSVPFSFVPPSAVGRHVLGIKVHKLDAPINVGGNTLVVPFRYVVKTQLASVR